MTLEELRAVAEIVEKLTNRYRDQEAAHKAALTEIRASCNARTSADEKIIEGLRAEIIRVNEAHGRTKVENDGLRDELTAQRDAFTAEVERIRRELCEGRDALRAEVKQLQKEHANDQSTVVKLLSEREGLCIQVQDMRAEITRITGNHDLIRREYDKALTLCETDEQTPAECIGSLNARIDRLQDDARSDARVHEELHRINVELRAEVAALKSQNPKEHPVKVGEWVRRLVPSPACDVGTVAKVVHVDDDTSEIEYDVKRIDGQHGVWFAKNCEPCDPPIVKREPTIGDTVRLVKIPIMGAVSPELQRVLEWPWIERWGTLNQTALVVEPAYQLEGALSVCLRTNVHVRWPVCCIEVVSEATHDTEAGKAAAESAVKTEPVTEEIKVGDLGEVFQATTRTLNSDVGITGCVSSIHLDPCHGGFLVKFDPSTQSRRSAGMQAFGLCDVRKVTTCEPVADEIKVGDVAKVVGASGDLTAQSDIGKIGEVLKIDFGDGTVLLSGAGWVNRCDVRKVTT